MGGARRGGDTMVAKARRQVRMSSSDRRLREASPAYSPEESWEALPPQGMDVVVSVRFSPSAARLLAKVARQAHLSPSALLRAWTHERLAVDGVGQPAHVAPSWRRRPTMVQRRTASRSCGIGIARRSSRSSSSVNRVLQAARSSTRRTATSSSQRERRSSPLTTSPRWAMRSSHSSSKKASGCTTLRPRPSTGGVVDLAKRQSKLARQILCNCSAMPILGSWLRSSGVWNPLCDRQWHSPDRSRPVARSPIPAVPVAQGLRVWFGGHPGGGTRWWAHPRKGLWGQGHDATSHAE